MFSVIILDFDEFLNKKKTIKYEVYLFCTDLGRK